MTTAQHNYLLMRIALEQFGKARTELEEAEMQQALQQAQQALALQQVVLASEEASRVCIPQSELQQGIKQLKERFPDQQAYRNALTLNELSEQGLAEALKAELHTEATLESVGQAVELMNEQDAQLYYEQNVAKFSQPERRYASHILITINPDFPENREAEVKKRIAQLAKEASASNFANLAKRHSECPTAMNDGELGWVEAGLLYPELDQQLFAMDEGDISQPIASEIGYHVLYCQEIKTAHTVSFAEACSKILQVHNDKRKSLYQKQWLRQLLQAEQTAESCAS